MTWRVEETTATPGSSWSGLESEGPPVAGPSNRDFGANFVVRSIEYELNGTAELQPVKAGLRWLR